MKHLLLSAFLLGLAACSPATEAASGEAGVGPAEAAAQPNAAPAGANDAITAWARNQYGAVNVFDPVEIFYGDFTGDGSPDALAWILYSGGGNSAMLDVALFRNEGGRMTYFRSAEAYGDTPRNVNISVGRITLTSTMPRPGDPRCCPTGSQDWTINTN